MATFGNEAENVATLDDKKLATFDDGPEPEWFPFGYNNPDDPDGERLQD